jgi:hypothetical protein
MPELWGLADNSQLKSTCKEKFLTRYNSKKQPAPFRLFRLFSSPPPNSIYTSVGEA